jgi:hypothetical protein
MPENLVRIVQVFSVSYRFNAVAGFAKGRAGYLDPGCSRSCSSGGVPRVLIHVSDAYSPIFTFEITNPSRM